ncbi:MAG: hypothetical protein HS128_20105 [Ideonella sp.]|nr:hypothetical protein [Ideonella sp.]MCC7458861.1 hypothetical protein [Nitrospira sp.]
MMTSSANRRLQIATRIHYALKRELGCGIDVGRLLKQPLYARDVLLVCDACDDSDLRRLGKAFRGISAALLHDVSGIGASSTFGVSTYDTSMLAASRFDTAAGGAAAALPAAVPAPR